jgi:hypothetical protein
MTKEQREKAIDNGQYTVVSNGALPSTSTCGNSRNWKAKDRRRVITRKTRIGRSK